MRRSSEFHNKNKNSADCIFAIVSGGCVRAVSVLAVLYTYDVRHGNVAPSVSDVS